MASLGAARAPTLPRRDGSSSQLFVTEDEDLLWRQQGEALAARALRSFALGSLGCGLQRRRKALAAVGIAALMATAALLAAEPLQAYGSRQEASAGRARVPARPRPKEGAELGARKLPEDLPPAPAPRPTFVGHPSYHCVYATAPACPARELFFSAEVHEVVTENLMQVGRGLLLHADRDLVRDTVAAGLGNLSLRLARREPELAGALGRVQLNESQKNLLLSSLRLMSIPEVQRIGYEVALAVRRSMSTDRRTVAREIEEMLASNVEEILRLRDEHVSAPLLRLWGREGGWELTLEPENLRVMQAFHGGEFFGSLNASFYAASRRAAARRLPAEEKAYGAWGGILEEGRALLALARLAARSAGAGELPRAGAAFSLAANVELGDLGRELLSCELYGGDGLDNFLKAIFCPLKYGSQGLDALRAVGRLRARGTPSTPAPAGPSLTGLGSMVAAA